MAQINTDTLNPYPDTFISYDEFKACGGQSSFEDFSLSSVLSLICNYCDKNLLDLVMRRGYDLNAPRQPTPLLHYMVWISRHKQERTLDFMAYLIDKGADIELRSQDRRTPLLEAVWNEDIAQVKFYLERGAQIFVQDKLEKNPFAMAAAIDEKRGLAIFEALLQSSQFDWGQALHFHVEPQSISPRPRFAHTLCLLTYKDKISSVDKILSYIPNEKTLAVLQAQMIEYGYDRDFPALQRSVEARQRVFDIHKENADLSQTIPLPATPVASDLPSKNKQRPSTLKI